MERDFTFGKKVRAARRAKDLTQFALSHRIGKTATFICKIERAEINVPPEVRKTLQRILGLNGSRK